MTEKKGPFKKHCVRCGKEFQTEVPNQKYCSKSCRDPVNQRGVCAYCGKPFFKGKSKYCSLECGVKARNNLMPNPFQGNTSGTTGAISELRVAIDLMSKGYDVFRALSPSCSCDLAILKEGKLLKIEVRTAHKNVRGVLYKTGRNTKVDHFAWVAPDEIVYEPLLPEN